MNIGIITYWESNDNYGQQLQIWGLQKTLKSLGHEPFLIRYVFSKSPFRKSRKSLLKKIAKLMCILPYLKDLKYKEKEKYLDKRNEGRRFNLFRDVNLNMSKDVYYSIYELRNHPPKADAYITGSDQVWSQLLNLEENKTFFLDFGDKKIKRIAYAPSFAMDSYPEPLRDILKKQLSHFDAVSVRESQGVKICNSVGVQAFHVLDPTLLHTRNDYEKLIDKEYGNSEIFVYSLNIMNSEEIRWDELQQYAKGRNLPISITTSSGYYKGFEICQNGKYVYPTIGEWLSRIQNAELVVTTSFHGVAFSIIMHARFVYIPLYGEKSPGNKRIFELLDYLDLSEHILTKGTNYVDVTLPPIDWMAVDRRLAQKKQESINFLYNI